MIYLLLATVTLATGLTSLNIHWRPAEGDAFYEVCARWLPNGERTCIETELLEVTIPLTDDKWTCAKITVENVLSDQPLPEPLIVIVNGNPADIDQSCAVGVHDFHKIIPEIGKQAPMRTGKPIIIDQGNH